MSAAWAVEGPERWRRDVKSRSWKAGEKNISEVV